MTLTQKEKLLRFALTAFGVIFCLIYPVGCGPPAGCGTEATANIICK